MKTNTVKEEWKHNVQVGDVFRSSWGYQNTTVDYYEVEDVYGKYVYVRQIKMESEETETEQGYCIPILGEFASPYRLRRLVEGTEGNEFVRIFSFANAYKQTPVEIVQGVLVYKPIRWGIPTSTSGGFQISDIGG
jgi:hypothetical protein